MPPPAPTPAAPVPIPVDVAPIPVAPGAPPQEMYHVNSHFERKIAKRAEGNLKAEASSKPKKTSGNSPKKKIGWQHRRKRVCLIWTFRAKASTIP